MLLIAFDLNSLDASSCYIQKPTNAFKLFLAFLNPTYYTSNYFLLGMFPPYFILQEGNMLLVAFNVNSLDVSSCQIQKPTNAFKLFFVFLNPTNSTSNNFHLVFFPPWKYLGCSLWPQFLLCYFLPIYKPTRASNLFFTSINFTSNHRFSLSVYAHFITRGK